MVMWHGRVLGVEPAGKMCVGLGIDNVSQDRVRVGPILWGLAHSFWVILKGVKPIGTQAIDRVALFWTRPPLTLCAHPDDCTANLISGPLLHSSLGISGRVCWPIPWWDRTRQGAYTTSRCLSLFISNYFFSRCTYYISQVFIHCLCITLYKIKVLKSLAWGM